MQRVNEVCATARVRYIDSSGIHTCTSMLCVWAPALTKVLHYNALNAVTRSKYRIAGSFFWGRKLSWIGEEDNFHREKFHGLLVFAMPKDATPPSFTEKTFTNSHKTAKFAKVFSFGSHMSPHLMKVLCYSTSNTVLWSKYTTEWCSISKDCHIIIHI